MAAKRAERDWSDVAIAMDRGLRVFSDFAKPILAMHAADNLSLSNLLFLVSVGGEARVNDLVKRGRYVGSNASYALKALQEGGFIERRQDESDRRNAVVTWTAKGSSLVASLKEACRTRDGSAADAETAMALFESHCVRLPAS